MLTQNLGRFHGETAPRYVGAFWRKRGGLLKNREYPASLEFLLNTSAKMKRPGFDEESVDPYFLKKYVILRGRYV